MARTVTVPAESDLLCESCGYVLNGLPEDGNCPECGTPIIQTIDVGRVPPPWEHGNPTWPRFVQTLVRVLFWPSWFYRTTTTRGDVRRSLRFAQVNWLVTAVIIAPGIFYHLAVFVSPLPVSTGSWLTFAMPLAIAVVVYLALAGITRLAGRLTHMEATYRGLRMPIAVVQRSLHYHAAHYLPVALVVSSTIIAFGVVPALQRSGNWGVHYLIALCCEIVIFAAYLFWTYWAGMRNIMYANK